MAEFWVLINEPSETIVANIHVVLLGEGYGCRPATPAATNSQGGVFQTSVDDVTLLLLLLLLRNQFLSSKQRARRSRLGPPGV
jgi:hypothetical protein